MQHEVFNALVDNRLSHCQELLGTKKEEYAQGEDRLHNFKKAGRMKDQDPVKALDGMWLKHRVSIDDIVERMAKDPSYVPDHHLVAEKIADNINYNLLLEGLIEDRRALRGGVQDMSTQLKRKLILLCNALFSGKPMRTA